MSVSFVVVAVFTIRVNALDAKSEIYSFYKLGLQSTGLFMWVLDTSWLFLQVL